MVLELVLRHTKPTLQLQASGDIFKCLRLKTSIRFASSSSSSKTDKDLDEKELSLDLINVEDSGCKIGVLQIYRPETRNALSINLLTRLQQYAHQLQFDRSVRVVILRSIVPGVFCAGAHLKERAAMDNDGVTRHTIFQRAAVTEFSNLPMPLIAAVDGHALGGGLELALACDLRVASTTAKLGLVETRLAIIPGAGGTARLPRIVGSARAKELIYTGRILDGAQAEQIGLVNIAVPENPNGDAAYQRALELAYEIVPNGPIAVRMAKTCLSRGDDVDLTSALKLEELCYAQVIPTKDRMEGLLAFKEKRKPKYKGD